MEKDQEKKDWRVLADETQLKFFETLGSRPYDEIGKSNLFLLKKKVGFATCGKPEELPTHSNYNTGYKENELEQIKSLCDKIIKESDYDPIRFACTILILHCKGQTSETAIFRIVTVSGNIFIDAHGRTYQDWKSFMEKNKLPDCEYCYPVDGEYNVEKGLRISFAHSPASSLFNKAVDCADTVGTFASVAAASVCAAGLFITVAPVMVSAAGATAAVTGVYSITRSVGSLVDRKQHAQSIGLNDKESRLAWMSIASSAAGVATVAAFGKAQKIVEGGKKLSKLGVVGLHTLTAASVFFSGFGFVETLIICVDKYDKGTLTKKDVFDLSCELLFLFNAIASAKASTNLVNNMSAAGSGAPSAAGSEAPSSAQKKLSKTQKRNLRKRAAKRRAKGISTNVHEELKQSPNSGFSTTLQLILIDAIQVYCPRGVEVLYICQSIGHDIKCWKMKEIPDLVFFSNLTKDLIRLYNDFQDEINEAIKKVKSYLSSLNFSKVKEVIYELFERASEEFKAIFCTKVINMEDQVDAMITNAELEVADLHKSLNIENSCNTFKSIMEDDESSDDNDFYPETQSLLSSCVDLVTTSSWSCNDLKEFGDILESVKYEVVIEFNAKLSNYKKSLEEAKSAAGGDSFNISIFHEVLGIRGDVCQHMFNKTLQCLNAPSAIYRIKTKCREIQKERDARTTPVWEGFTEGMFHYYGPAGAGNMSKDELLSVVSNVVKISFTEVNYKWLEDKDVIMIDLIKHSEKQIVVYRGITEKNTESGVIFMVS